MWRWTTTKALCSRSPSVLVSCEHVVSAPLAARFSAETRRNLAPPREPVEPAQDPGGEPNGRSYVPVALGAGALGIGGLLAYNWWTNNTSSFTKEMEKQKLVPDNKAPTKETNTGASVIDVAGNSVNVLSLDQAKVHDMEKMQAEQHEKQRRRYEEKMAAKQAEDDEYLRQERERRELQATIELEKQKKEEAAEEALAESAMNRTRKNQEFEAKAAKMLSRVHEVANTAMNANSVAISTCREHNAKLMEAMDVNLEEEALAIWPEVQKLNEVRIEQVEEAHRLQLIAEAVIVEYLQVIDEAKKSPDTKDNCNLPIYRKQVQEIAYDVKTIYDKMKSQEQVSSIMKHYYQLLKRDKADFIKELEAIVPQVKINENGLDVTEEERNALLAHSHRRIFQLKKQLREQQMLEHQRLEDALCEQKKLDMKEANLKLGQELDKQYEDLLLEREAQILAHDRTFETEMRQRLSKQASEHHDHLQDMLALQQKKLMEQFDLALRERLIHERHMFIDYIGKNMAKVKGLEAALEERADLEKTITQVQDLMSSSLCLIHAVAHEVDCVGEEYKRARIDEALRRCFLAAEMHPFAQAVLYSIPNKAAEEGIYTMTAIERRFREFYDKSISNAKWSDTLLSYFTPEPLPKFIHVCDFDSVDGMTTEELLIQAKYFMDRKCLPEVVRCIVALTGTPRELSQGWLEEARLVLEVRQAAEVLMAYANSKGMGTIF
ncbi:MICOS complex subunit MIC60-like [Watersipora subatra]|uniref:MICOS complex subunit MIC60-like n=1 Tax=Watersipora subatra TaxID=2589382 RepID=UPI00355AF66C